MEFTDNLKTFMEEKFPGVDIYNMSLEELKLLKDEVDIIRNEYMLLELACKTLGNAAYGAAANHTFYFYNIKLAGDITGECRQLTQTMNKNLIDWFHEGIWERKDLWKQFDFELDESKHDWYRQQPVWIYSDTDSIVENSLLLIKRDNKIYPVSIKELFHNNYLNNGVFAFDESGKEIAKSTDEILNWSKDRGLYFAPIKYVMKHKVSKPKYKIKTKSGKEIIVTGDHSCIVFRNGEQLTIKAKDINKDTDKILSIK